MGLAGTMSAAGKVLARTSYYLGYRSLTNPREARAFARTVAEAITEFKWWDGKDCERTLPRMSLAALYPGMEQHAVAIRFTGSTRNELPLPECGAIATIIRQAAPQRIFEIGTERGRTTLLMAENAPAGATVHTLNLPVEEMAAFNGISRDEARTLIGEAFRGQPAATRITQLLSDSRTFDFSPYAKAMDLIFIDGDHSYEGVKNDTERCLPMLRPGGIVVWDDYHPTYPGIVRYLNELAKSRRIVQIAGTRLAWYRLDAANHVETS